MGVVGKNASQEYKTKANTPFCYPDVQYGPPEDMPGARVGNFTLILPYNMLFTERMPTSQVGSSSYLVPSLDEILGDNKEE